jgi:hypothetical protein
VIKTSGSPVYSTSRYKLEENGTAEIHNFEIVMTQQCCLWTMSLWMRNIGKSIYTKRQQEEFTTTSQIFIWLGILYK